VGVQGFDQLIKAAGGMADGVESGHENYSAIKVERNLTPRGSLLRWPCGNIRTLGEHMRFRPSLLIPAALAFLVSCGTTSQPIAIPSVRIPVGMRMVSIRLERVSIKVGDHVDVVALDEGHETPVLSNVEVVALTNVDAKRDVVSLIVSPDDTQKLVEASQQHKVRLRSTSAS
jgi:hypothetical protein